MNDEVFNCKAPKYIPKNGNGIIYIYTFENGMQYIGQTTRSASHRHQKHIEKNNLLIDKCLKKYKWSLSVIGEYPKEMLDYKENQFIVIFNTLHPHGYNMVVEIDGRINYCKLSRINKSVCRLGMRPSEETRKKLSDAKIGNTWNRGRKMSEVDKTKRSICMKKMWSDPFFKENRVKAIKKGKGLEVEE